LLDCPSILLAGILSIPKYKVNSNQLVATNNKFKNKKLRIRPELLELLKLKGDATFSIFELCHAYEELPVCRELTKKQVMQFIVRNLKRLEGKGLAIKTCMKRGSGTRYKLSNSFHDGQYTVGSPHCSTASNETKVSAFLLNKLKKKLGEHEINLVVTLSEIEEYKNLGLQNPSVKRPLKSLYAEARDHSSKLLGQIKATESLLAEIRR